MDAHGDQSGLGTVPRQVGKALASGDGSGRDPWSTRREAKVVVDGVGLLPARSFLHLHSRRGK